MRIKIAIILIVLFVCAVSVLSLRRDTAWPLGSELVLQGLPLSNFDTIKSAMQYHGCKVAQRDEAGEWWFYREGKRLSLGEPK